MDAIQIALTEQWANPSALYGFGFDAAKALRTARTQVAKALGAEVDRVYFTSGGTEADNWALFGSAKRFGKKNRHIISTAVEHHAVLNALKELEAQGFEVTYLQPDASGIITLDKLKNAIRKDTFLVSIMMVNNETGAVMPIEKMAKLTHRMCPDAIFHTDAVQGFLKIPFQAKSLGADLISVSAHKVHGVKGAGALYISPKLKSFPPYIYGGGQENNFRSGTEAMPAIVGFGAACESISATFKEDIAREKRMMEALAKKLSELPGVLINGCHEAPHILSVAIPGIPTQNIINILQDNGICVSAGSACAKGHRSHTLTAMGISPEAMDGSFRVSICRDTVQEDLDKLMQVITQEILPRVR